MGALANLFFLDQDYLKSFWETFIGNNERGEKNLEISCLKARTRHIIARSWLLFEGLFIMTISRLLVRIHGGLETTENSKTRVLIWYTSC